MSNVKFLFEGKEYSSCVQHYRNLRRSEINMVFYEAYMLGQVDAYKENPVIGKNQIRTFTDKLKNGECPRITDITVCFIKDNNRHVVAMGYAFCSESDQFARRVGRRIATNRAMSHLKNKYKE